MLGVPRALLQPGLRKGILSAMQPTPKPLPPVSIKEAGLPLQDYLANALKISRRTAKQQIDAKAVWVNDRCVWMARHPLRKGDVVHLTRRVASPTARSRPDPVLAVLFEDDDFVAIDKPAGIVSNDSDSSAEAILRRQTATPALRAAHRLDRDTSGCLLLARTDAAYEEAVAMFRQHRVAKTYRAVVHGRWAADASTIALPIEEERALSHVTCLRANDLASHLSVRIETGRTHQIRRHLAMARHPVIGDRQYGPKEIPDRMLRDVGRPLLHAIEFQMDRPGRDRALRVFAPLPAEFHRWLIALKLSEGRRAPTPP